MPTLVGGAHASHEARVAQVLFDGRGLIQGGDQVGVARSAREARHEIQVQIVQARLHHGPRFPLDVGFQLGLQQAVQGIAVQDAVGTVLVEVEGATVAYRLGCWRNDHLQAEAAAIEHQLYGAGEIEGLGDGAGDRTHNAVRLALDHAAAVDVGVQDESAAAGIGDAANQFHAVVAPDRAAGDRQGRFRCCHGILSLTLAIPVQHIIGEAQRFRHDPLKGVNPERGEAGCDSWAKFDI